MQPNRASNASIISALERIGADHPPALTAVLERHAKIRKTQADQPAARGIVGAVLDTLAAGKQPASDKSVQSIVAAQAVDTLGPALEARMIEEVGEAIRQDPGAVIEAMRPRFDALAADLLGHHEALGGVSLDDPRAVLHLAGDAAQHHADARTTLASLKVIEDGWRSLALTLGITTDRRTPLAWCAAVDPEQDLDVDLTGKTPWSLLDQNIGLRLATPGEAKNIGPTIRAAQGQRHDRAAAAATRRAPIVVRT